MIIGKELSKKKKKKITFSKTEVHVVPSFKKYNKTQSKYCCFNY